MTQIRSPELKKKSKILCTESPGFLHPSLHRALKLTFLMDVGVIVLDIRITSETGIWSLGKSVGVLSLQISIQSASRKRGGGVLSKNVYQTSQFKCEGLEGPE